MNRAVIPPLLSPGPVGVRPVGQHRRRPRPGCPEDRAALEKQIFEVLSRSHWVAEGPANPERVVYTFTDMKCPYCTRQWRDMRPCWTIRTTAPRCAT
ncbi:hypothetical protein HML84_13860 [Alcanivorax sp. IO_7]|nr:hypothetical protein HML84_13860 [Alcanivorax sp. IO_7]